MTATAFSLENLAKRSCNYLDRMVDGTGLPYFNVFYARSAQAYSDFDNRMQPVFYGEPGPCGCISGKAIWRILHPRPNRCGLPAIHLSGDKYQGGKNAKGCDCRNRKRSHP